MKTFITTALLLCAAVCKAQSGYMAADSVAMFYPDRFDASQHLPSPIFVREPAFSSPLDSQWQLRPTFKTENGRSYASFSVGDADLYGCGEVYGPLRRNGDTVGLYNKDNGAYAAEGGKRLYQSHPWVLGVRRDGTAFGLIADNTWRGKVTLRSTVTFESEGPAFRVAVLEGNTPADVLRRLARLIGTIDLPPLWALGYQQCRFSYFPDSRVLEVGHTFRQKHIPCDVVWMDIDYMDGYRIFTFDKQKFPDPKGFNDKMHQMKMKTVFMIDPAPKTDSTYFVYRQAIENGYCVADSNGKPYVGNMWPGKVVFPDFTRPEVRSWWSGLYKDFMATGVDGVWNDVNEPQNSGGPDSTLPDDCRHGGGDGSAPGPHLRYHNLYGYNMIRATRDGILQANPTRRPFVLSRANFLGGQRYGATWTGDNCSRDDHMRVSIPMTLNMGLTCQPFNGPDIGGFLDNCTPELLADWTAQGVYFPFVRNHACAGTKDQEPWAFGKATEDVCRTAINRRYRLLPYYYTLFRQTSLDGMPIMRPLFLSNPKDTTLRSEDRAFTIGSDLLVVPRWAEGKTAMPSGRWTRFNMEDSDDGHQALLSLREGAALPLANLYENTIDYRTDSLTVIVNPDASGVARGQLYEDSGDGFGYRSGDYAQYDILCTKAGRKLRLSLRQTSGNRRHEGRTLRVAVIRKGRLVYSPWMKGESVEAKF